MIVNNRKLIAVYIRGLAFRCGAGSRREQVLRALLKQDEDSQTSLLLLFAATAVLFWGVGILSAWWIL